MLSNGREVEDSQLEFVMALGYYNLGEDVIRYLTAPSRASEAYRTCLRMTSF